jgi:hypothetical protein
MSRIEMQRSAAARSLAFMAALLLGAGCATQPSKAPSAANANAAGTDTQCHSEALTGSLISKTVCTTKAQRDAQQALVGEVQNSSMQSVEGHGTQPPLPGRP